MEYGDYKLEFEFISRQRGVYCIVTCIVTKPIDLALKLYSFFLTNSS